MYLVLMLNLHLFDNTIKPKLKMVDKHMHRRQRDQGIRCFLSQKGLTLFFLILFYSKRLNFFSFFFFFFLSQNICVNILVCLSLLNNCFSILLLLLVCYDQQTNSRTRNDDNKCQSLINCILYGSLLVFFTNKCS